MPEAGAVTLRVVCCSGTSIVKEQSGRAPLQVHRPLYLEDHLYPTVYLRTPSSGLLHGDAYQVDAHIEQDATLELRTQAATLIYPGVSAQRLRFSLSPGASLYFQPHQLILAEDADFQQDIEVRMHKSSGLILSDHWAAGRIAMSESWKFKRFANAIRIWVDDALEYCEQWTLSPAQNEFRSELMCGQFLQFKSLYVFGHAHGNGNGNQFDSDSDRREARCWSLPRPHGTITRRVWT